MSKAYKILLSSIVLGVFFTILFFVLYRIFDISVYLSLHITFLTVTYHFLMRVIVGESVTFSYKSRKFNIHSAWFKEHTFEKALYTHLRVKKWKNFMITARPEQFDIKTLTTDELIHNITQAELVHEIIVPLSFLPLTLINFYGSAAVFIITSVFAAFVDSLFVLIQRYNRPRVLKFCSKSTFCKPDKKL